MATITVIIERGRPVLGSDIPLRLTADDKDIVDISRIEAAIQAVASHETESNRCLIDIFQAEGISGFALTVGTHPPDA